MVSAASSLLMDIHCCLDLPGLHVWRRADVPRVPVLAAAPAQAQRLEGPGCGLLRQQVLPHHAPQQRRHHHSVRPRSGAPDHRASNARAGHNVPAALRGRAAGRIRPQQGHVRHEPGRHAGDPVSPLSCCLRHTRQGRRQDQIFINNTACHGSSSPRTAAVANDNACTTSLQLTPKIPHPRVRTFLY